MNPTCSELTTAALNARHRAILAEERAEFYAAEQQPEQAATYHTQALNMWAMAEACAAQARAVA
jgi:hypothetical protein